MKIFKEIRFLEQDCNLVVERYVEGGVAILIKTTRGEPMACCTVNVPNLSDNEVAIKNWSENEGMDDLLLECGVINAYPVDSIVSGFVHIPVYTLTRNFTEAMQ